VPGCVADQHPPASVDLTVERKVLTVKAERRWEPAEPDQVLMRERPQAASPARWPCRTLSTSTRSRPAPERGVAGEPPVAEAAKPHHIQIKARDAKAITASEPAKEPALA
jgi:HSP20 family protein